MIRLISWTLFNPQITAVVNSCCLLWILLWKRNDVVGYCSTNLASKWHGCPSSWVSSKMQFVLFTNFISPRGILYEYYLACRPLIHHGSSWRTGSVLGRLLMVDRSFSTVQNGPPFKLDALWALLLCTEFCKTRSRKFHVDEPRTPPSRQLMFCPGTTSRLWLPHGSGVSQESTGIIDFQYIVIYMVETFKSKALNGGQGQPWAHLDHVDYSCHGFSAYYPSLDFLTNGRSSELLVMWSWRA